MNSNEFPLSLPEYIPSCAGEGRHRKTVQRRTLTYWMVMAGVSLIFFSNGPSPVWSPKIRAATLSLVFPGAGYIACANVQGLILFIVTLFLLPLTLFAWFGAGGLAFPLLLWTLSIPGAYFSASPNAVYEGAAVVAGLLLAVPILFFNRSSARARGCADAKRKQRNLQLPSALECVQSNAMEPPPDEDRELSLSDLRRLQFLFDVGMQALDNWSNFTIIDQFQTSALRYQVYEMMYCLGIYQGIYAPNFHGYCSEFFRKAIERSLMPKVLGFWKWESLWGKFSTNFDPITEDNIMVSGWFLQGLALYTANTGDLRYTKPGSLCFQVTPRHTYKHDIHAIVKALVRQWESNPYTLFPCEPNWIYSPCNLQGIVGQVVYDRVFGTTYAKDLSPKFEAALTSEFMEPSGSIIPIRSALTGFSIPGLCGALGDLSNAMMCRGHMDHIARRVWAIFRQENIQISGEGSKGEMEMVGLVGADLIDPGSYKPNPSGILPMVAHTAGEFGDEVVREKALQTMEKEIGSTTSETGSVCWNRERVSFSMQTGTIKASLLRQGDWKRLISEGPSKTTLQGPILFQVPYPGVLVAKARSITSRDLNLVLYPSAEGGRFRIGISRLQPGGRYTCSEQNLTFAADETGHAELDVLVDGRTEMHMIPETNTA